MPRESDTAAKERKWWDRWAVGFWGGIALASVLYPFIHPPEIKITRLTDADMDKIAQMIAAALPYVKEMSHGD